MIEFMKMTEFPRGTLYDILADAYSYDPRNRQIWDANWKETDDPTTKRMRQLDRLIDVLATGKPMEKVLR